MRNSSTSPLTATSRTQHWLARSRSHCLQWLEETASSSPMMRSVLLGVMMLMILSPLFLFITPHLTGSSVHVLPTVLVGLVFLITLAHLALHGTDPGYVLNDPFANESPLGDIETLDTLHKWAAKYPNLVQAREAEDEKCDNDGITMIPLASSKTDDICKTRVTDLMKRISEAHELGESGLGEVEECVQQLKRLVDPYNHEAPLGACSLTELPLPPTRPHFIPPTVRKHAALLLDEEERTKRDENEASTMTPAQRKARKKERRARAEKRNYEMRRKDGEQSLPSESTLADEVKEMELSMASATEEEIEESMRSRIGLDQSSSSSTGTVAVAGLNGVLPNPFANAGNFFRHDFQSHPIEEHERSALIAQARDDHARANTSTWWNTNQSATQPPTDEFYIGNPRWHPNKLRDELDRFAMDRWGLREEFCMDCMAWRPLGARHCHTCQLCVHHPLSHAMTFGCCIGRSNVRFLLLINTLLVLLSIVAAFTAVTVIKSTHDIFSASTWRVEVAKGMSESGQSVYTWNWLLMIQLLIAGSWIAASLVNTIVALMTIGDIFRTANYILMGEGGALAADAPSHRMKMTPLQLTLYSDLGSLVQYLVERICFAPLEGGLPCYQANRMQANIARSTRAQARARRIEWRQLREAAIARAKGEQRTLSSPPHHGVQIQQ